MMACVPTYGLCHPHTHHTQPTYGLRHPPTHHTHTVPFMMHSTSGHCYRPLSHDPGLSDVAPTVLDLMGLDIPKEMTGQSLLLKS